MKDFSKEIRFGWRNRLDVVLQGHESECGLACLSMILGFHGDPIPLHELRKRTWSSMRGHNLRQLSGIAESLDFQSRAIRLELNDLQDIRLPAIVHVNGNHFVVLERITSRAVHVVDPAIGRQRYRLDKFGKIFTGVVLELSPMQKMAKGEKRERLGLNLLGRVKGIRSSLGWVLLLAIALEVTILIVPLIIQATVDVVVVNRDTSLLLVIACSYMAIVVAQATIGGFRAWAVSTIGASLNVGWTQNVFRHLIHLDERYFSNRSIGDISSRFGGIDSIQRTLSIGAIDALLDGAMMLVIFLVLVSYSGVLAAIVGAGAVAYLLLRIAALRVMMDANIDVIAAGAKKETAFIESLRLINVLKLNGMMGSQIERFSERLTGFQMKSIKLQSMMLLFGGIGTILFGLIKIITLYLGAAQAISGSFTAGMLVAFLAYIDQFTGRSSKIIDYFISLKLVRVQIVRVFDITKTERESNFRGAYRSDLEDYSISMNSIGFRYGNDDAWILRGLNISVSEGEFVAITGPSGSGKSTIVRLLSGLQDPITGQINVGGMDARLLGKERLREIVSVVMQDDLLMAGTIFENISCFSQDATMERVIRAASLAGVHEAIMAMPMRYESQIGDMGALVSGGQRQRMCLARALYREPKILVLDEATSNLDVQTEKSIAENIAALNVTRIVISHRPESLASAEKVYSLRNGILHLVEEKVLGASTRGVRQETLSRGDA